MNTYELTYIVPVKAEGEDIPSIQARIDGVLTKNGAKKSSIQNEFTSPQKKRLSYEIGNIQYGYYATVYFDASAEAIENITKELKMDNGVLRFLIVSVKGEIPQGVVISRKEVEQQLDEVVENITKETEASIQSKAKEEKALETELRPAALKEEAGGKEENIENKKGRRSKEEPKESKKAALEDLDEKLDEILGE